jgi:hypothetical protein
MALLAGDPVLPTAVAVDGVLQTSGSSRVLFGCGDTQALANSGASWNVAAAALLREVAPGTSGLFGKCVQVDTESVSRRGTVIAELQIELDTSGGTGALTECVLVQPRGGERFLARVSDVSEVVC